MRYEEDGSDEDSGRVNCISYRWSYRIIIMRITVMTVVATSVVRADGGET